MVRNVTFPSRFRPRVRWSYPFFIVHCWTRWSERTTNFSPQPISSDDVTSFSEIGSSPFFEDFCLRSHWCLEEDPSRVFKDLTEVPSDSSSRFLSFTSYFPPRTVYDVVPASRMFSFPLDCVPPSEVLGTFPRHRTPSHPSPCEPLLPQGTPYS